MDKLNTISITSTLIQISNQINAIANNPTSERTAAFTKELPQIFSWLFSPDGLLTKAYYSILASTSSQNYQVPKHLQINDEEIYNLIEFLSPRSQKLKTKEITLFSFIMDNSLWNSLQFSYEFDNLPVQTKVLFIEALEQNSFNHPILFQYQELFNQNLNKLNKYKALILNIFELFLFNFISCLRYCQIGKKQQSRFNIVTYIQICIYQWYSRISFLKIMKLI